MIRSWLAYITLLIIDVLLWLTVDGYVYYFLFRVMLLLPIISFVLFLIGKRKLALHLTKKENHIVVTIDSKLPSSLCSQLILHGEWKNIFHGIQKETEKVFSEDKLEIERPDLGSGFYAFNIQSIQCYDLLHLFRYRYKCEYEIESYQFPQPIILQEQALNHLQNKTEKQKNAQIDTDYEIKEYQEGEIPAHIHYSSSNRFQKLMLKKFDTMQDSHIQMHICFPEEVNDCELVLSVCVGLCQKANEHNTFYLYWQDEKITHKLKIQHNADVKKFLLTCLAMPKYTGSPVKTDGIIYLDSALCHRLTQEVSL